jgi:hypothetical protein
LACFYKTLTMGARRSCGQFLLFTEFDSALNAQLLQLVSCCSQFLRSLLHQ